MRRTAIFVALNIFGELVHVEKYQLFGMQTLSPPTNRYTISRPFYRQIVLGAFCYAAPVIFTEQIVASARIINYGRKSRSNHCTKS